jgi:hypothetical protein
MSDSIVYLNISIGGGMDGLDHTDKGGKIMSAHVDKTAANKAKTPWTTVEPTVQDLSEIANKIYDSLDPLQQLALNTTFFMNVDEYEF